ncbi:putative Histone-lysine N-methyltransferase [Georgfuchsia toluolica]|uniref:Histone-lysine N-methyltransferase n=1 Tax=Georgfuchsia toluolica TaxID=424218 RepID=A0A916J5X0_9PROT|nr:SET domain-containing protein-lysine N-methyltransferase [Georgfuchsia toluolica]CAG4884834.1 putative Histone-lysine N-methyltransferase [Georgfuchsia toluolica]
MSRSKTSSKIEVRQSGIHGKGVYATRRIRKDSAIIEYTGERVSEDEANERYQDNPSTYLFMVDDDTFIDGLSGGNEARFINHSCEPNCVAYLEDDRVVIHALKNIQPGVELTYDYQLTDEGEGSDATPTDYTCRCGARRCTGTMKGREA